MYIGCLRRKLAAEGRPVPIVLVSSGGYRLSEESRSPLDR
ncbi:MAG: helix-turn-helix domain-containing protein [Solirubrobacteraceae bacterium]